MIQEGAQVGSMILIFITGLILAFGKTSSRSWRLSKIVFCLSVVVAASCFLLFGDT